MLKSEKLGALTLSVKDEIAAIQDYCEGKPKDDPAVKLFTAVAGRLQTHVDQYGEESIYIGGRTVVKDEARQRVFDEQISPMFDRLREISLKYGMPLASAVQIDNGKMGELRSYGPEVTADAPDIEMQLVAFAIACRGDIADLVNKIVHIASVIGHDSDVLRRAGVSDEPDPEVLKALSE